MNDLYAPVVIPTLCRYEHLKCCLESLSECTGAEKTDVFIGLDYPTNEKHWDGYNKIKEFLEHASFKFAHFNVIVRDHNYGFGANGNLASLRKMIFCKYDRIIESEDDNVFSPNFLEFINKGLEKFKDDKTVFAINAYRHPHNIKKDDNTFIRQNVDFSGWGYGMWRDRFETLPPLDFFRKSFSIRRFFKTKCDVGANRALNFWYYAKKIPRDWWDSPLSVYMYLNNKDVVMPSGYSLVKNLGWDGSGVHNDCGGEIYASQIISSEKCFSYVGTGFEYYKECRKIFKKNSFAKISEMRFFCKSIIFIVQYLYMLMKFKDFRVDIFSEKN